MPVETYNVSNPAKPVITKDPDAILDYSEDWTEWLAQTGDVITLFTPIPNGAMVVESQANDGEIVTAFLSGGVAGTTESVTYRIDTAQGRRDERTLFFKIKDR